MSWRNFLKNYFGKRQKARKPPPEPKPTLLTPKSISSVISGKDGKGPIYTGRETQYVGTSEANQRRQLIIGLDFGTAFTKVVVSDALDNFFAVPLCTDFKNEQAYLLPGRFFINTKKECELFNIKGKQVKNLKLRLLEGNFAANTRKEVGTFLALVFRQIRSYILNSKSDIYGNNYLDWIVNIGLPTEHYHDDKLAGNYQKIVHAAWIASVLPESISVNRTSQLIEKGKKLNHHELKTLSRRIIKEDAISIFPEFVAQVTGYVRSPQRQSDLHLLIDVGAGTVDATVFNVHKNKDGEDRFPIFAKSVMSMGTEFLIKHRFNKREKDKCFSIDAFDPVPSNVIFANKLKITLDELEILDRPFQAQLTNQIIENLNYTRLKRYPTSRHWVYGLPFFLCGGGSKCNFYGNTFGSIDGKIGGFPVKLRELPKPDNFESPGLNSDHYHRFLVAYGLAFEPADIGEIKKMGEIEDFDKNSLKLPTSTQSPFCKKCGGTGGLHRPCDVCGGSGFPPHQ